jgi:hypothetical protein
VRGGDREGYSTELNVGCERGQREGCGINGAFNEEGESRELGFPVAVGYGT